MKTMLLLCALIIGSVSSAWGETSTLTFTAACGGSGTADDGASWTVTSDGTESNFDGTKGIHYGTGSAAVQYITLSTSGISGTITQIKVNASTAKGVTATVSVTVDGNAFGGDAQSLSKTAADYTFTGSASGEIIVTVTKQESATGALYVKSVAVTYSSGATTTTTIDASGISNTDVYKGTSAGTLVASVTKTSDESAVAGAAVTWSSSDKDVATIGEETGVVTLVAPGDVTFTANYAGDENYAGSSNTYNMTVTSSAPDQLFFLVNDVNDLAAGDKIIIVSSEKVMSTTQNSNNRGATTNGFTIETDGSIRVPTSTEVQILTLEGKSGAWYLNTGSGYLYAASSSSNYLRTETEAEKDDNAKAEIAFSGDNASIVFQGTNTRNDLRYNSGSSIFSCYASTSDMAAVQIYKATATFEINALCTDGEGMYYGTYSNDHAFVVPADLIVSEIKLDAQNKLVISDYATGAVVPANTGVMVSSDVAGAHTVNLSAEAGTSVLGAENLLKASSVAMTGDFKFYRLTMHEGTTIGFYPGAANGAAFDIAANKAYLAVSTALARVAGFNLFEDEGEATAIEGVKTIGMDAPVFNLNGQRVNGNAKGLLIKNGKKYMNR